MLFAIILAVASLVVSFFMAQSLREDVEDYALNVEDPSQPKPTMPVRATPTPSPTPKPTATPAPLETDDQPEQSTPAPEATPDADE